MEIQALETQMMTKDEIDSIYIPVLVALKVAKVIQDAGYDWADTSLNVDTLFDEAKRRFLSFQANRLEKAKQMPKLEKAN